MKKWLKSIMAITLALAIIFGIAMFAPNRTVNAGSFVNATLLRIGGTDRYDTANRIAQAGWTTSDTVFLASASNYADALAGAPLAYKSDAPILLVSGNSVPKSVMQQIYDLGATRISILGGTASVSEGIEKELEAKNFG